MPQKKPLEGELLPKRGAPVKYDPAMCEKIIEVAREGGGVAAMCLAVGLKSRTSFYNYLKEYPEFKDAYDEALTESQALHEQLLLGIASGRVKNGNFSALAMIMNNRFPEDYRRGPNGGGTEINIGSINNLETLDNKSLDAKIEALTKKLGLAPKEEQSAE